MIGPAPPDVSAPGAVSVALVLTLSGCSGSRVRCGIRTTPSTAADSPTRRTAASRSSRSSASRDVGPGRGEVDQPVDGPDVLVGRRPLSPAGPKAAPTSGRLDAAQVGARVLAPAAGVGQGGDPRDALVADMPADAQRAARRQHPGDLGPATGESNQCQACSAITASTLLSPNGIDSAPPTSTSRLGRVAAQSSRASPRSGRPPSSASRAPPASGCPCRSRRRGRAPGRPAGRSPISHADRRGRPLRPHRVVRRCEVAERRASLFVELGAVHDRVVAVVRHGPKLPPAGPRASR